MQYGRTVVEGSIEEYSLSQMNNYDYRSTVDQTALLGTMSADVVRWGRLRWYVTGGIGGVYNDNSVYREAAKVSPVRENLGFSNHGRWQLAYLLSSGLRWSLSGTTEMSLSYEYLNTGKASLGTSGIRPGVVGPSITLRNHLALLTFTHLF